MSSLALASYRKSEIKTLNAKSKLVLVIAIYTNIWVMSLNLASFQSPQGTQTSVFASYVSLPMHREYCEVLVTQRTWWNKTGFRAKNCQILENTLARLSQKKKKITSPPVGDDFMQLIHQRFEFWVRSGKQQYTTSIVNFIGFGSFDAHLGTQNRGVPAHIIHTPSSRP